MSGLQKNRPGWKWILITGLVLGIAATGCRHRGHSYWGHDDPTDRIERMTGHMDELLDKIDATPEQRCSIHAALDPLLQRARGLEGSRDMIRSAYHTAWADSTFDPARLTTLLDEEVDKLVPLLRDLTAAMGEVHAVLSPEQRETIASHVGKHRRR